MLEIHPASPLIGAEIVGVEAKSLDEAGFAPIYQALLDHIVIVLRNQTLEIEDFLGIARRFGRPKPHMVKQSRHPQFPDLMLMDSKASVKNAPAEVGAGKPNMTLVRRGLGWHSDLGYEDVPAKATQLYGIKIPSRGGDTLYASMYAAYDALPDALKRRIETLTARFRYGGRTRSQVELLDDEARNRPDAVHPIVRVHPETGRKALYISPRQILGVNGLSAAESEALIAELETYIEQPGATYRHRWQPGDLVVWDNRCLLHSATGDYPPDEHRFHWRVTIMDDAAQARADAA